MIENVVVYGSGLMGRGIAQVAATYGYKVTLIDLNKNVLNIAQSGIKKSLERIASKRYTNDKAKSEEFVNGITGHIQYLTTNESREALEVSDLIIEAVVEDLNVKRKLFKNLENSIKSSTNLATNTSSLSVKDICKDLNLKNRFAGLHFFNPVPMMKLVEVIKTEDTDNKVIEKLITFIKSLEKVPVLCKDTPGFIVNRLLVPYLMQAVELHEAGVASKEDIDIAVKLGLGYPMGPFQLLDYVGLDTVNAIIQSWNQADIKVPRTIEELVENGKYGNKTGEGFYKHPPKRASPQDLFISLVDTLHTLNFYESEYVILHFICLEDTRTIRIWSNDKADTVPLIECNSTTLFFPSLTLNLELSKVQNALITTPNFGQVIVQIDTIEDWCDLVFSENVELKKIDDDTLGILNIEIVACKNLPKANKLLQSWRVLHPFAVVCFGRQTYRTRVVRNTLNPVWKEKAALSLKSSSNNHYVMISIYDHDSFGRNTCIGSTNIRSSYFINRPNETQRLALMLELTRPGPLTDCHLLVKGVYTPFTNLRKQFWHILAEPYCECPGCITKDGITIMLETIGSNIREETWEGIFSKLKQTANYTFDMDQVAEALEDLTIHPRNPKGTDQENIILIRECPICKKHWSIHSSDVDVITHLGVCSQNHRNFDALMLGGFLTEEYASRKWFMRLFSYMSFGGYSIGKNNGNIFVQDRYTGKLIEEKIPTYIRFGLRMLHQNIMRAQTANFAMTRKLFHALSIRQGQKFDDPASTRSIPGFIKYHGINVHEILNPLDTFRTFNEFFYRELKPGSRPIASPDDPSIIVSPADSRCGVFTSVSEAKRLWIKGRKFTVTELLQDDHLGKYFENGAIMLCRLAPQDYHRFHSPIEAKIISIQTIVGEYYTVNPMAVRQHIDVLTENARTVVLLESIEFGKVAYVAVGAMLVGSVIITKAEGKQVKKSDELGYFSFGGSTIVVIFQEGCVDFSLDLVNNSRDQLETLIKMGDKVGRKIIKNN